MKILIVEDDPLIRQGLIDALSREGYELISAENGKLALARIDADGAVFDVGMATFGTGDLDAQRVALVALGERCLEAFDEVELVDLALMRQRLQRLNQF